MKYWKKGQRKKDKERKKEVKRMFEETMAENIPNLKKNVNTIKAQQLQTEKKQRSTARLIIIKLSKNRQRIRKAARDLNDLYI